MLQIGDMRYVLVGDLDLQTQHRGQNTSSKMGLCVSEGENHII